MGQRVGAVPVVVFGAGPVLRGVIGDFGDPMPMLVLVTVTMVVAVIVGITRVVVMPERVVKRGVQDREDLEAHDPKRHQDQGRATPAPAGGCGPRR